MSSLAIQRRGSPSPVARRRAWVMDPRLALSAWGMHLAARLATAFDVWLPTALRHVICEPRAWRDESSKLVPRVFDRRRRELDPRAEAAAVADALVSWQAAPDARETDAPVLYWVGDRADESSLPPDPRGGLSRRFFAFAESLDLLVEEAGYDLPRGQVVSDGFRDTVALAAALQPERAVILSRLEADGGGAPALCDYLDSWEVPAAEAPGRGDGAARLLREELAEADIEPLLWAGLALVAVHVVMPERPFPAKDARSPWKDARIFWHRL